MPRDEWTDKLEIRDMLERSIRYSDDGDFDRLIVLFDEDAELMTAGRIIQGHGSTASVAWWHRAAEVPMPSVVSLSDRCTARHRHAASRPMVVARKRATAREETKEAR